MALRYVKSLTNSKLSFAFFANSCNRFALSDDFANGHRTDLTGVRVKSRMTHRTGQFTGAAVFNQG